MIIGTTPTHIFTLPFSTDGLSEVRVIYAQENQPIVTKTTEDCDLNGNHIMVNLTQVDTFNFDHNKPLQIQVRVKTNTGEVMSSAVKTIGVGMCLENEVV